VKALLERLRLPALAVLAAAAPLGAWLKLGVPLAGVKGAVAVGAFDLAVWPALALVVLLRLLREGPRGVLRLAARAPSAGWLLLALAAWSGLAWPRLAGTPPVALAAVAKELVQIAEYGVVALVVAAELAGDDGRGRRMALGILGALAGVIVIWGAAQYFGGRSDFEVGSLLGNRNALGAFLAVMVPFAAALALGRSGCCCWWNAAWGLLAAGGTLLALSGGAVLGIACGTLAGAALLGRRKLAVAAAALVVFLAAGQALGRHNLSAALDSVRLERKNPRTGEMVLALRYLRYGSELNVLRLGLSGEQAGKLCFGLGPGGYDREKTFRPNLDSRFVETSGQTDTPENYDVLANEPNSFDLWLGQGAQLGALGLLGFLWLFAWFSGAALRSWRRSAPEDPLRTVAAGAFGAAVGAAAAGVFTSPWIQGAGPVLVMLVALALGAAGKRPKQPAGGAPEVVRV